MQEEKILKALYYIRNRQIINSIKADEAKLESCQGYLYAIKNEVYPIFDLDGDDREEIELYSDFYVIKKDFIEKVTKKVGSLYEKKEYKHFYYWEDIFGKEYRDDLIKIFKYCKLLGKFNDAFWNVLVDHENNPIEAEIILD